ncbi:MAG: hypothetical protein F6J93_35115 [Oscillatoria sp. SIO1A7]|nr:hypothetical protein [Oscillatoria sp. SIO1A7]
MHSYNFLFLAGIAMLGLFANFAFGATNAVAMGDSLVLEQELSDGLNSNQDNKPHRGSGR